MDQLKTWHHEGIEMPTLVNKQVLLGELKNFEVRHDDIWLCTYPKAGMHWTWHIINLLKHDGDFNKLNTFTQSNPPPSSPIEITMTLPDGTAFRSYEYFQSLPSPRLITTHLPLNLLPTQVFEKKVKIIYVARNPKDIAVSLYHFVKPSVEALGEQLPWNAFIDVFMSEKASYGSWSSHGLPFWKRRHDDNVLFLKFEDMKANQLAAVRDIAIFTNNSTSEDVLRSTAENSSVKKTKELWDAKQNRGCAADTMSIGSFVRKGIIGDWKTHFTVAQSQAYDLLIDNDLKGSGLVMQYE